TAVGALSLAVAELLAEPPPARLEGPAAELFAFVAPEMGFLHRALFANAWIFGSAILAQLERSPSTNALVRTTVAPTLLRAGVKDNVLPSQASAVVNFRILPGETQAQVLAYVQQTVGALGVSARPLAGGGLVSEPSPVSRT